MIALAGLARRYGLSFLRDLRLLDPGGRLFLDPGAIPSRLLAAFLLAGGRRTIIPIGLGDSPSRRVVPTIVSAVPIEMMIGREIPITLLEQALSGRKLRRFALPGSGRGRIL